MSKQKERTFGQFLRDSRNEQGFTLRKFAQMVGLSPTYVSKVERDEMNPPSEDTIKRIAQCLGIDVDELLALAGKVSSDLTQIILGEPRLYADFLRTAQSRTKTEIEQATDRLKQQNSKRRTERRN
jgi:HTH-type transcriptional regulator, competence development regulator